MNNRQVGAVREAEAAAYLSQNGYQILEKNFRCRTGEIDIIARAPGTVGRFDVVAVEKTKITLLKNAFGI